MTRGDFIAISMLKQSAAAPPGVTERVARRVAKAVRGAVGAAGGAGGAVAEEFGAPKVIGTALGVGALGTGAYLGGRRAKQRYQQWKWNTFGPPMGYGY